MNAQQLIQTIREAGAADDQSILDALCDGAALEAMGATDQDDVEEAFSIIQAKLRSGTNSVIYNGQSIDLDAARMVMDDELCEQIHGTVETEQEFVDAYAAAHEEKYGEAFVFN